MMGKRLDPAVERGVRYFKKRLWEALGTQVIALKLFGSQLRGNASPESDVDILVVVRERTWEIEKQISHIAYETDLAFDVFLSPTVYGEEEYSNPVLQASPFIQCVEREGLPV